MKDWENKAALLRALEYGRDGEKFVPQDDEETRLWIQVCDYDTIPRNPPDSVNLDSVLIDTARSFEKLESLRSASPPNFHLDSLYGEALLIRDRAVEAGQVVGKYLKFQNVQRYVRTVQGFASYDRGDFGRALKNLILGQNRSLSVLYRIADCLEKTNRDGRDYYRAALALSPDSALRTTYLKKLLPIEFARGNYPALTAIPFADLSADTGLVRIYLMSLARAGLRPRADSLYLAYFGGFDPDYINRFGEYLIDGRSFPRALVLYDSLIAAAATRLSDQIFYNWALVPFQSGAYDTAQERFRFFTVQFKNSPKYGAVLFKIATIKYQLGDFDSAGFYYLKSVTDSSLRHDALQNGMIAYKKAEDWKEVIGLGRKFLDVCAEAEKPEAAFEIGYAHLRLGSFRKSIDYFRKAVAGDPQPEFHYWLAETYLGRGDFIRALYHYQAIVNKFPKDEMWEPTAEFKSGLALEFLDATVEAKKLYEGIIKRRGKEDVWGKEAVKRLELLK